jgi:2-methylisocitrate lyase-like PEP mutase family enzyme
MVGRKAAQYMQAGIAALHLEDQAQTKRCRHLANKALVSEAKHLSRIRAAVNMCASLPSDIVIIALTDAIQSLGFNAAPQRLNAAIAIGADVAFLEGVESKEQAREVCRVLDPAPVLFNCVQGV